MNAVALPTTYRLLAAGCVWRAATITDPTSSLVLLSTAISASFDLAPSAAEQFASSKRARAMDLDGSGTWRTVVRTKLLAQLAGLVASAALGRALGGASCIVAANAVFWASGAGDARFVCDGTAEVGVRRAPIKASLARALFGVNVVMLCALLAGCCGRGGSLLRKGGASVFCAGVLSQTFGDGKTRRKDRKTKGL